MKYKKQFLTLLVLVVSVFLLGCQKADMEGIVIEADEDSILLATELTAAEYEEMKDKSPSEFQEKDLFGDEYYGLVHLTYEQAAEYNKGDFVEV